MSALSIAATANYAYPIREELIGAIEERIRLILGAYGFNVQSVDISISEPSERQPI